MHRIKLWSKRILVAAVPARISHTLGKLQISQTGQLWLRSAELSHKVREPFLFISILLSVFSIVDQGPLGHSISAKESFDL